MLESHQQSKFNAEIAIHLPERSGLDKPIVWVFPELLICLNCGKAEFDIPEDELRLLIKGAVASARIAAHKCTQGEAIGAGNAS